MSEVEKKASMDRRNNSGRQPQLTAPRPSASSNSASENASSVGKFSGSYQKRDFAYNASSEASASKKCPQPREKISFKENGAKKFSSKEHRDYGVKDPFSGDGRHSKKLSEAALERAYDDTGRRNGGSAKGVMNSAKSLEVGYRPWKDRNVASSRKSTKVPYCKEQFLQANCQFVVRKNGNYAIHTIDPDTLVDWDLIEQVRIFDHEVPSCPICLYPPKAAKITRCGHSYCWPCMLHYMSLFDENYVNCPICFARVREKDLKSVVALQTICFNIGQDITMKLMKKCRGKTLVSPRAIWSSDLRKPFSVADRENMSYAKLLTADAAYIRHILEAEREELVLLLLHEDSPNSLEGSFVTAAMKSLEERAFKLKCIALESAESTESDETQPYPPKENAAEISHTAQTLASAKSSIKYASAFSDEELAEDANRNPDHPSDPSSSNIPVKNGDQSSDVVTCVTHDSSASTAEVLAVVDRDDDVKVTTYVNASEDKASYYKKKRERSETACFYQAADGQHIYLHGLNVSCLKEQYGDLANCPDELTGHIVDLERIFMDEELRRKYRWLNHLPLTCEFMMAELELRPPLVSQEILDQFAVEILKRQQERERKQQYDNKRAQRIQNEESRRMGIDPHSRIVRSEFKKGIRPSSVCSIDRAFSSMPCPDQFGPSGGPSRSSLASEENGVDGLSRNSCSSNDAPLASVPSFAQMLKMGNPKQVSGAWEKSLQTSEEKRERNGSESSGEESARPPAFQYALMCDIGKKLAEFDLAENNDQGFDESANNGKKKKKLKKLLFTSGHMFHNNR